MPENEADEKEMKYLQIRIRARRKRRWKEFVERDPRFRSLTHMIVDSVEDAIRDDAGDELAGVELESVHDRLDNLRDELHEVANRIDETYVHVRDEATGRYTEISSRVQDLIPMGDREEVLALQPSEPAAATPEEELVDEVERTGSVSHLVRLLQLEGYPPIEVKGTVEQLADEVAGIEATYARPQEQEDKRIYRVS